MVLFSATAIALLVILACGGRFRGLATLRVRLPFLVIGSALLTKAVFETGLYYDHRALGSSLWMLGFVGTIVFLGVNRAERWLLVAAAGAASNVAVIFANDGVMPVGRIGFEVFRLLPNWYVQPGLDGGRPELWADQSTPLWFLGDVLPPFIPWSFAWSVGDGVLAAGVIGVIAKYMMRARRPGRAEAAAATMGAPLAAGAAPAALGALQLQLAGATLLRPASLALELASPQTLRLMSDTLSEVERLAGELRGYVDLVDTRATQDVGPLGPRPLEQPHPTDDQAARPAA